MAVAELPMGGARVNTDETVSRGGSGRAEGSKLRLAAVALALGGVILALVCTRHGVGIGGDGIGYVAAARNLAGGEGLSWIGPGHDVRPMVIFGPLFPFLLSLPARLGLDPYVGARWLNAALYGLNLLLFVAVLFWATRQAWIALVGGVIAIFSAELLALHTGAVSEPVFLALLLVSLALLTAYQERGNRWQLAVSAVAMGVAYLARYAGLMFAAASLAALVLLGRGAWRRRLLDAGIYSLLFGSVAGAWMLRNHLVVGTATSRSLSFLPPSLSLFVSFGDIITYWFLPERLGLGPRVGVFLIGAVFLGLAWLRCMRGDAAERPAGEADSRREVLFSGVTGVASVVYLGGLVASRTFIVPRISIDGRILVPVHLLLLLLVLTLVSGISRAGGKRRILASVVIAGTFLFALSYVGRGTIRALMLQLDGQGFSSRAWRGSPLINALRLLPADTPIYTNEVEALYLLAGRSAYRLPTGCLPEDAMTAMVVAENCQTPEYRVWAEAMRDRIIHEWAVVAVFNTYTEQPYYAPLVSEMVAGLDILSTQGDGRMYVYDGDQWPDNPNW
jgi:hypothetical protein